MGTRDSLVEALRRLCDKEGGHAVVAEVAGVSADNLWQILKGIKLPSGEPRGVGPRLARKLDAAFPGWADSPASQSPVMDPAAGSGTFLQQALEHLARSLGELSRVERRQAAALLPMLAEEPEARAETCEALMRLLQPAKPYTYVQTWEEAARAVEQEIGDRRLSVGELLEWVSRARELPVQPVGARTGAHKAAS